MDFNTLPNDFLSPQAISVVDDYATDPLFIASQEELRALLFSTARSLAPTRAPSPDECIEHTTVSVSREGGSAAGYMSRIVVSTRRVEYLQNYIQEVAPWLDMFDMQRHFGTVLLRKAGQSEALLCAILALSARQLERKKHMKESFESLELYQRSIRLVGPLLPSRTAEVVAIAVILCCMEMMSASARDWRRHLEGCAGLFDAFEMNGFSGGLSQGVFWCYARMDLCGALISDTMESTLLPLDRWTPVGHQSVEYIRTLFRRAGTADMWANYAVYLCAHACNLLSDRTRFTELGDEQGCNNIDFVRRWKEVWEEQQCWLALRQTEMKPIETIPATPFPQILYTHWAAISSNQLYHTACVLLLSNMPDSVQLESSPAASAVWHAKRICGISQTNPHHGCLNNAIQPLWIAGRVLGHPFEHTALVRLIKHIEKTTGWSMSWRIRDLEQEWGYAEGTYSIS